MSRLDLCPEPKFADVFRRAPPRGVAPSSDIRHILGRPPRAPRPDDELRFLDTGEGLRLQFEDRLQGRIRGLAEHATGDVLAEHDAVFVAVTGSAADEPYVLERRMSLHDEIGIDTHFVLADLAFDQGLIFEQRKPPRDEFAALGDFLRRQHPLLCVGIDQERAFQGHLEPPPFDARKAVGAADRPIREIRIGEPLVAGRRAVEQLQLSWRSQLIGHDIRKDLGQPRPHREHERLCRDRLAVGQRHLLQLPASLTAERRPGDGEAPPALLKGVGDRLAPFTRFEDAGARGVHRDVDALGIDLREPARHVGMGQDVGLDADAVEDRLRLLEVLRPLLGQCDLAGLEKSVRPHSACRRFQRAKASTTQRV